MTPETEQNRLSAAQEGASGVSSVLLHPDLGEIEINAKGDDKPRRDDITTAASSVGFTIYVVKRVASAPGNETGEGV